MTPIAGGPTPGAADRLLILAALGDQAVARRAWDEWQRDASLDDVQPGGFAILPAVSRNLDRLKIDHPHATTLRGIYRHAWTQSQLTLRDLLQLHRALADAGVRAVAHRGVPVVERYLGDLAAVASDQNDLLVAAADLGRAAATLSALGWSPLGAIPPSAIRTAFARQVFEARSRTRVVLHWRSFPLGVPFHREADVIKRATAYHTQGGSLLLPDSTDQLLLLCSRLREMADVERARWTLEMCAVLRDDMGRLDARAFAERAEGADVLTVCVESLNAVHLLVGDDLPFVRSIALPPAGGREAGAAAFTAPRNLIERVARAARAAVERYGAVCRSNGTTRTPWGFARFTVAFYHHEWRR